MSEKRKATDDDDVFHYVSYIHFKNNIYEIDGMREGPILLAENVDNNDWVEKVKPLILNRISLYASNEIKFNLLAMVPNRMNRLAEQEKDLQKRYDYVLKLLENKASKSQDQDSEDVTVNFILFQMNEVYGDYDVLNREELERAKEEIELTLDNTRNQMMEENFKFERYKLENQRRQHNYIPLIFELLKIMGEKNVLEEMYSTAKTEMENKKK